MPTTANVGVGASQASLGRADQADVFLRRTPREYMQYQLPSTLSAVTSFTVSNNYANLPVRKHLSFETGSRDQIVPQKYLEQMEKSQRWCEKIAAEGVPEAETVAQILAASCQLNQEILDRHYSVILC